MYTQVENIIQETLYIFVTILIINILNIISGKEWDWNGLFFGMYVLFENLKF